MRSGCTDGERGEDMSSLNANEIGRDVVAVGVIVLLRVQVLDDPVCGCGCAGDERDRRTHAGTAPARARSAFAEGLPMRTFLMRLRSACGSQEPTRAMFIQTGQA